MTAPWRRKRNPYDLIRELHEIELAIQWRLDQIRLLYKTIDLLREHKDRIDLRLEQYERYQNGRS